MVEQDLCGGKGIPEAVEFTVGRTAGDGLQEVGGGFFPEALEGSETTVLAGGSECGEILDAQFFPQGSKFFWAKAGEVEEGKKARGDRGAELFQVGEFAGGHQGGDFFAQGFADARKFAEAVRPDEFPQIGWGGFESTGGGEIGPALEGVLPLKLQNRTDFAQRVGGLVLGHGFKLSTDSLKGQGKWLVAIDRNGEGGDALGSTR